MKIRRYHAMRLGDRYYVNDPDTMTAARFSSMRDADHVARDLNAGRVDRSTITWLDLD